VGSEDALARRLVADYERAARECSVTVRRRCRDGCCPHDGAH